MVDLSDLVNCGIGDADLEELSLFDLQVLLEAIKQEIRKRKRRI